MKKRILASLMAVLVTAVTVAGCGTTEGSEAKGKDETLLEVSVVSPKVTDVNVTGEYVGTLEYEDQVSVFPMLSGEITNTYFEEGDYVEAGELMFTLDDTAYQLQLQNAQKVYQSAETGLDQQLGALDMQRASAENNVNTAREGINQIEDSYNYYNEQMEDLDKTKAKIQQDRDEMKEDLIKLRKDRDDAKKKLDEAKGGLDKAQDMYAKATQDNIVAQATGATPPHSDAEMKVLKETMEGAATGVAGLNQQIAAYDSAEKQMESAIKQYDSSMDQLDSSKEGLKFQQENLNYSMEQARRGEAIAQENLNYFDNYTAPLTQKSAEISLGQARIGISSAELQLSYTKVKAPASGKIIAKNYDSKDMAQAGYPVYIIIPDNTKYASFNVPESVWKELKVGDAVTVERNGVTYEGKITEVATAINPQVGMFTVKAAISGDTEDLVPGTSVVVKAVTKSLSGTTTIPIDCVYYEAGKSYTYAVSSDGIISKVYIETGMYDDENMEIKSGITPDMMIITTWSSDYHDGLKVNIKSQEN